jgi:nitrogen-specific signal transduction histidine kinase
LGDSIFDPFVTTKGEDHPGLGLFLAAKALEKWGGIIEHKGNEPCVFAIGLPR